LEFQLKEMTNYQRNGGLSEIDCKKKTERILSVTLYDTDGNVLFSRNYDKREWSYVIPDSRGDILLKKVCK